MNNLKTKLLETVKNNDIRMIPKWRFMFFSSLLISGILLMFCVLIFVMSLIFFVLSRYGFMDLGLLGFLHTVQALNAIPFALLLCALLLLVIIEATSYKYSISFRQPLAVTLLIILSGALVISYIISRTSGHLYVRDYIRSNNFDVLSRAYERPASPTRIHGMDVIRGEVIRTSKDPRSVTVRLFDGSAIVASATTTNDRTAVLVLPTIGDDVVIFGTFMNDHFEAIHIRKAYRP